MTILTVDHKASPRPGLATGIASLRRWLGDALGACVKAWVKHRERQNAITMLREFSDYELRDIGLSRTSIEPRFTASIPVRTLPTKAPRRKSENAQAA